MIRFQTATHNDTKTIALLVNSAYRGDYSTLGWTTEAHLLDGQRTDADAICEIVNHPESLIEILFEGNSSNPTGSVVITKEPSATLYFGMLTVEPTKQGQGVGKMLLNHVENIAQSLRFKKIRCTVISSRIELINFYKRRGFRESGKFEEFPPDPKFGIPKVNGIRLMELEKILG